MRLFGDGKHGQAEPIQTLRCQACRPTFTARRDTPLYRLKTPSQQVALVLAAASRRAGPDLAASRVFGLRQATITRWLTRAGEHAQILHERLICTLWLPHVHLDALRTRLRCSQPVRLALAGSRSAHQASARASARSSYAEQGTYRDSLPAREPGRLSACPSSRAMGSISPSTWLSAHFGPWLQERRRSRNVRR